jgi:hypothetical protein
MRDDKALHGGELLKVGLSGEVDVKAQTGFRVGGHFGEPKRRPRYFFV